jgi:type I restriction enzyme S subunit
LSFAKSIILDLSIHGNLVPQDPADEPAADLLKRVNPNAVVSADTSHYQHLPQGWCACRLEDIVDYEQPQRYIVESTSYNDTYKTPVLTAGKSFIIGYTNETAGIFNNLPVIIFDDFTTDSKYVDFPFKVKSSAMKILHVKNGVNVKYVYYFMSITRLVGKTHKRYWISEYSKLNIPLPPYNEQCRIVEAIENINRRIDDIAEAL